MNMNLSFEHGKARYGLGEILRPFSESATVKPCVMESGMLPYGRLGLMAAEMEKILLEEKFFLDRQCTIERLARKMTTNRTYLAEAVHRLYGIRFRPLVAILRVEYSKSLLVEMPDVNIDQLLTQSGFLYMSQYDRKFRELNGLTPREWRHMACEAKQKLHENASG